MAYKVGGTVVIDDAGKIDWNRIKKPVEMPQGATETLTEGAGNILSGTTTKLSFDADGGFHYITTNTYTNCNCNCACNCNCRC